MKPISLTASSGASLTALEDIKVCISPGPRAGDTHTRAIPKLEDVLHPSCEISNNIFTKSCSCRVTFICRETNSE